MVSEFFSMSIELDPDAVQVCRLLCRGLLIAFTGLIAVTVTITLIVILFTNNVTPLPSYAYPYPYEMIMNILMTFYILGRIAGYFLVYYLSKQEKEADYSKKWHSLTQ